MLPNDKSRCKGEMGIIQCSKRRSCARYLQLDVCASWTPIGQMLSVSAYKADIILVANECLHFIEVAE